MKSKQESCCGSAMDFTLLKGDLLKSRAHPSLALVFVLHLALRRVFYGAFSAELGSSAQIGREGS